MTEEKAKKITITGEKARRLANLLCEEDADVFEILEGLPTEIAEEVLLVQDAVNPFEEYLGIFKKHLEIRW